MHRAALMVSAAALAGALVAAPAQAAANRTFVSGTGNDANACTFAAPCRTLQAAFNATAASGEIIALDATGYGTLTITHSISIIGAEVATSITAPANGAGISIQAQSGDTVILRNLQITGANAAGSVGISINGGHLILQDTTLKMLTTGMSVSNTKVDIIHSDIVGNSTGIVTNGTGMDSLNPSNGPNTGITEVRIASGNILGNTTGWTMNNPGVGTSNTNKVTVFVFNTSATSIYGNGTYFTVTGTGSVCSGTNVCVAWIGISYNSGSTFQ